MKNNKGVTLTSLVIYIVLVTVVMAIVMRITTHFSNNMEDAANVAFETEFNKINLYLLDETKKTGNEIAEITQDGMAVSFSKGNRYVYNYTDKSIYLNDGIKICQNIETCLFEQKTAENGKNILSLTITIDNITKTTEYVCSTKVATQSGKLLPDEYQQVEYIQSTGTQYINTDILDIATEILEYNIDIQINEGNTRGCFGANDGSYISFVDNHVYAIWGNSFFENDNERHTITIKNHKEESATYFYQDSTFKSKVVSGKILLGNNFSLFAVGMDSSGSVAYNSKCKLYSLKAIRDGILIGDFIPCYRKSDNVVGLYDLVNNVFYTNQGTGEFIKGEDITDTTASENEDSKDFIDINDYLWGSSLISYYLKVGDYVDYRPDAGVYKVADGTKGAGYTAAQSFTTDDLKWRIFSIDEQTGKIELISETVAQSSTSLYLQGADGYNHGVDILNDLCDKLYSKTVDGTKVATARSINIEDINNKTTFSPQDYTAYGGTPYTPSGKQYPNVYAIELGSTEQGLNADEKLLKESERIETGTENSQGITEYTKYTGSSTASTLYSTYTYYQYYPEENLKQNMGINTMPLGVIKTDLGYWIASRYAASSAERVGFGIRRMDAEGMVNRDYLFRSTGGTNSVGYGVRPIVTLNAIELLDFKTGDGTKEKPWGMK